MRRGDADGHLAAQARTPLYVVLAALPTGGLRGRRAARNGAVAVRVEVVEKLVERIVERVRIETRCAPSSPAEAAQIVLRSPRACRTVLESLTAEVDSGRLDTGAHAPTLRAAQRLLASLRRARLIDC